MPFPNFHSARIRTPGSFSRIREIDQAEDGAIRFIGGPLKSDPGGGAEIQAIRFEKDKYTVAQAKAWLKEHDFKSISFEKAEEKKQDSVEVFRIDNVPIGKLERREDGTLFGEPVITRAGVFTYQGPTGETIQEFRPPDEVFRDDSLATAQLIPITVEHPAEGRVTPSNAKSLAVGTTGESVRQDGTNVRAPLRITAQEGVKAVEDGKRQLSLGYRCQVERADGQFEGQPYTHVQREIRYNHLALTVKARAGEVASVRLDAADAIMVDKAGGPAPAAPAGRSGPMPLQLRLDNGCGYEVPAEVEAAFKARTQERDDLKTKLDAITAEKDTATKELATATAQRDEAKASLEKANKTDHAEAIRTGVKARLGLESAARRAKLEKDVLEKLDSMSDDEVRLAVIQSRHKDFEPKDKVPEYIAARFDAVVEGLDAEPDQGGTIAGHGSQSRNDATCEEVRKRRIDEMKRRSRGEKEEKK